MPPVSGRSQLALAISSALAGFAWGMLRHRGHARARGLAMLQAAEWFVYPSLYEGFGLPVAEAMACGVPPIVSRASSLPEIVGEVGFQFDPVEVTELGELLATVHLSGSDRKAAAEAALARSRRFDWTEAATGLQSMMEGILASHG